MKVSVDLHGQALDDARRRGLDGDRRRIERNPRRVDRDLARSHRELDLDLGGGQNGALHHVEHLIAIRDGRLVRRAARRRLEFRPAEVFDSSPLLAT